MPSYVDVQASIASATTACRLLFDDRDVYALYRRWYEEEAVVKQIWRASSLTECMARPYAQSGDHFTASLLRQRSDIKELVLLKEGRWLYYEGIAGAEF